jgi:hypothetical protein
MYSSIKATSFFGVLSLICAVLSGCAGAPNPGPYNGLNTSPHAAVSKIACMKYTEDMPTGATLTPDEAQFCSDQAMKCQFEFNLQSSSFAETALSNGAVSTVAGAASFKAEASALHVVKAVAGRYPVAGAAIGAISSVNPSLLMYSGAQDGAVGSCARDFAGYYKRKHPGIHDDIFIEAVMIRTNIQGNVKK